MKRFGILFDIRHVEYLENWVLSSRLARDNDKLISYSAKTCQQTNLSNAGRQPRPGPGWVQDSLSLKEFLLCCQTLLVVLSWVWRQLGPDSRLGAASIGDLEPGLAGGDQRILADLALAVSVMTREQPQHQLCQRFFVSHQAVEFGQGRVSNGGHIRVYKSVPF